MAWSRLHVARGLAAASLVLSATSVWAIVTLLRQYEEVARPVPVPEVPIVLAARTLYPGVPLTADDLRVEVRPVDALPFALGPDGHLVAAEIFATPGALLGRVPRERIVVDDVIRPERLARGDLGVGLNALVPRGLRAISLGLQGADAVSGYLVPGSRVDVLVTAKDELGVRRTDTLMQAVPVLAVNSRAVGETAEDARERGPRAPSVTFLVTASQAEELALADVIGDVSLTLRNPDDETTRVLAGVDLDGMLGIFRPLPVAAAAVRPRVRVTVVEPDAPRPERPGILLIRATNVQEVPLEAGMIPWP